MSSSERPSICIHLYTFMYHVHMNTCVSRFRVKYDMMWTIFYPARLHDGKWVLVLFLFPRLLHVFHCSHQHSRSFVLLSQFHFLHKVLVLTAELIHENDESAKA